MPHAGARARGVSLASTRTQLPIGLPRGYGSTVSSTDAASSLGDWPVDGLERVDRCPACGNASRSLLYGELTDRSYLCAPGRWNLFRCAECSSAYLDPRPDDRTIHLAYGNYYEGPAPRPPRDASGWRAIRRAIRNGYLNSRYGYDLAPASALGSLLVPLLPHQREKTDEHVRHLRLLPGKPRLLDVGCGEGDFLAEMQALGWEAEGIDPSANAVAVARRRGVRVAQGGLEDVSLDEAAFDAITFRLVFEHLRNPVTALLTCRRALRPSGILWIAAPNLTSEASRFFGGDWIFLEPPRHAVLYTPSSLTRLLTRTGFQPVQLRPSRQAAWSFRMSAAIARGVPPFRKTPPLSWAHALRAQLADLRALARPELAEVVIVIASNG
jgi:SAM-dependent methyltransferase